MLPAPLLRLRFDWRVRRSFGLFESLSECQTLVSSCLAALSGAIDFMSSSAEADIQLCGDDPLGADTTRVTRVSENSAGDEVLQGRSGYETARWDSKALDGLFL